jgi:hypothetical protein
MTSSREVAIWSLREKKGEREGGQYTAITR